MVEAWSGFVRAYQPGVAIRRLRIGKSCVSISKTRCVVFKSTSSRMMTVRKHAGCECIIRRDVFKAQHTIATDALQRLRTREGGMR